jgi:hypothetical protein
MQFAVNMKQSFTPTYLESFGSGASGCLWSSLNGITGQFTWENFCLEYSTTS